MSPDPSVSLGARAAPLLRARHRRGLAYRQPSAAEHRHALSDGGRLQRLRAGQATPELEPWLRESLAVVSRKRKLAQAIRYGLSHWGTLDRNRLQNGRGV